MLTQSYRDRFGGLARVYGEPALARLQAAHFCVVGVGGVGSWAAEACARSGIGSITLIDHDDIDISNTNRQLHSLVSTLQRSKVEVLRERIVDINPECECSAIDDLVTRGNVDRFEFARYDYVIDAIDHVSHKLTLMHHCRRNKIRCVSTGGAGGLNIGVGKGEGGLRDVELDGAGERVYHGRARIAGPAVGGALRRSGRSVGRVR